MRSRLPEQLWALSRSLYRNNRPRLSRAVKTVNWFLHKCLLPSEAVVGRDILLEHYALGIVLHPQVTIGDNCRIFHHVTLAAESPIGSPHRIILGDNVTIGAHSVVVARQNSNLTIGNNSLLGAGSVLLTDIPPFEVWAGNPARKIKDVPRT
ncbi:MAG: DapH/DapD/GlmU-related protein [Terrimicrobiaceae bacterium]